MKTKVIFALVTVIILTISASATVINVPTAFSTIQGAIDAAVDRDTVLVAPGVYQEHIDFDGKEIVLMSESGAETTIIEKSYRNIPIVNFINNENQNSVLKGFTIRNSNRSGIICIDSDPLIRDCIIENNINNSHDYNIRGGGIVIRNDARPKIIGNIIRNNYGIHGGGINIRSCDINYPTFIDSNYIYGNTAANNGAGFHAYLSWYVFSHNVVYDNQAGITGGGLRIDAYGGVIENNTICSNTAALYAGGVFCEGEAAGNYIRNNIIYDNSLYGLQVYSGSNYHLLYNCFYDNGSGPHIGNAIEEANIYLNPLFVDILVNDYRLYASSPCIDAGDPSSPLDSNGTIADIGALEPLAYDGYGAISGTVTDEYSNPIEGVNVGVVSYGGSDISNENGVYYIDNLNAPNLYSVFLNHIDFKDTILAGIPVSGDETTARNMTLERLGAFTGLVTDIDYQPLEGILVTSVRGGSVTGIDTTDNSGEYRIGYLESGYHWATFSSDLYEDIGNTYLNITPGDTLSLDVTMLRTGSIKGTIIGDYNEPVLHAEIRLNDDAGSHGVTDSYGRYQIDGIVEGVYDMEFRQYGYLDTIISNVELAGHSMALMNVVLSPLPNCSATLWLGNVDGSSVNAPIGGSLEFDVYASTADSIYISEVSIPLGADERYFVDFNRMDGQVHYPLTEWPMLLFAETVGSPPNFDGWVSERAYGWADRHGEDRGPWLHSDTPVKIITFVLDTQNDPSLIGDTLKCVGLGEGYFPTFYLDDTLGVVIPEAFDVNVSPIAFGLATDFAVLTGGIANPEMNPVEGVEISIVDKFISTFSDSNGVFGFDRLIPGDYVFELHHPHYIDSVIPGVNLPRGDSINWDITLGHLGAIAGVVVDTGARPIDDVYIEVVGHSEINDFTEADGIYKLDYLDLAEYQVSFSHPYYSDTVIGSISATSGDTTIIDMIMSPFPFDIYLWFGGEFSGGAWQDIITIAPGESFDVDVWLNCRADIHVADLLCVIGANTNYCAGIEQSECSAYYPLTEWDEAVFENPATYDDFHSLSLSGQARTGPDENPWLHYEIPGKILTFVVRSENDLDLIGLTLDDALMQGDDPIKGGHSAEDTLSTACTIRHRYARMSFCEPDFAYLPGDVNMFNGSWPPSIIGGDVTYLVNYFRGVISSSPCNLVGFWASADANGDCGVIGSDVTKLVSYFRGQAELAWCPDYMPLWPAPSELPAEAPEGWPNCDEFDLSGQKAAPSKLE
ncbi:MAG: hypothetical protein GY839_19275 [candidate division Zixibacteria bacterium]|nr:hypothetical protein [candidate division Zixibacteria bacterium]